MILSITASRKHFEINNQDFMQRKKIQILRVCVRPSTFLWIGTRNSEISPFVNINGNSNWTYIITRHCVIEHIIYNILCRKLIFLNIITLFPFYPIFMKEISLFMWFIVWFDIISTTTSKDLELTSVSIKYHYIRNIQ